MHLTLPHVVSDVTGATGMAILRAMLAGERAPVQMARLRNDRGHQDEEPIANALPGQWRAEPLFARAQAVALDAMEHEKLVACDRPSEAPLGPFAERQAHDAVLPQVRPRKRTRHRPRFDVRGTRQRVTGVDLTAIEGMDEPTALTIIREIGRDMGRWPPVQHFTAGLGRCPPHRGCGGKVWARGTTPCANRVAPARRLAASGLQRSQSALGAFCRRLNARLGTPTAITATAHKRARLSYTMLKHGPADVRQSLADDAHHDRDRMSQQLTRRAKALGYAWGQPPVGTPG
jgi:transposase